MSKKRGSKKTKNDVLKQDNYSVQDASESVSPENETDSDMQGLYQDDSYGQEMNLEMEAPINQDGYYSQEYTGYDEQAYYNRDGYVEYQDSMGYDAGQGESYQQDYQEVNPEYPGATYGNGYDGAYDYQMMTGDEQYQPADYQGYNDDNMQYMNHFNGDEPAEYTGETAGFDGLTGRYAEYDEYAEEDFEDYEEDDNVVEQKKSEKKNRSESSFDKINNWISSNRVICYGALGTILALAIIIVIIAKVRGQETVSSNSANQVELSGNVSSNSATIPQDPLLINNYPEVNGLVNQYFEARQANDIETVNRLRNYADPIEAAKLAAMSQYVESYNDITCYTKPGPFENSYLTYISYNVKLYNWEELAPSLLTLLICTNDDGSLYIYSGDFDKNVEQYIGAISQQEDVKDLMTRVDAEYKEVLDTNSDFKDYMQEFNSHIKDEVKTQLAALKIAEDEANKGDESVSDNEVKEIVTFEVKATDTVNVRASDSEDADRVGRVEAGTVLECYEQRTNGWSQVVYEGEIAYIKSDYLVNLSATRTSGDEDVTGTVRAKETVNIRDKDSTDGRQLGVAYMGESFPLIEHQSNGWSKIIYNDMDAYIKTEYLE